MEFSQSNTIRIVLLFVCLALWNLVLVSCGDDEGEDEGIMNGNRQHQVVIEPSQVDWIGESQVKLVWVAQPDANSYLAYDNTSDGPMIRGSIDALPESHMMEIVLDNVDPSHLHIFRILPE
jgi:hypothetical protein